ncbi:hypothetical protein ACQY0O_004677 [Thecaphora frezii]
MLHPEAISHDVQPSPQQLDFAYNPSLATTSSFSRHPLRPTTARAIQITCPPSAPHVATPSPLLRLLPMSSNTALSKKERHYAHLASQLDTLSHTLATLQDRITVAAEQAHYVRKLGIGQAAIFMAALDTVNKEGQAESVRQQQQQSEAEGET